MEEKMFSVVIPKTLIVLKYHFIDYLDARFEPYDIYGKLEDVDTAIEAVKNIFLKNGWEGD